MELPNQNTITPSNQVLPLGSDPRAQLPAVVYLTRLTSEHSRRAMFSALQRALRAAGILTDPLTFDWRLSYAQVIALRAALLTRHDPATVNQTLSAIRGVMREAWRLGLLSAEEYHRSTDITGIKTQKLPAGRIVGNGELRHIFDLCVNDTSAIGVRDTALLGILFGCGLRRSEVVTLLLSDVEPEGALKIRTGKGGKDRMVYIPAAVTQVLERWITQRGDWEGALFTRIGKGENITHTRLTPQAVWFIIEKRSAEAGIHFTPHDSRRTFITSLLDLGVDVITVQRLAGHANPNTTGRYDRRGEVAKRRAIETLHLPLPSIESTK